MKSSGNRCRASATLSIPDKCSQPVMFNRLRLLVTANILPSSPILVTLMMWALGSSPKRRFLQEPHGVTSQKTPFFIVTAVKTSNLTKIKHRLGWACHHHGNSRPRKYCPSSSCSRSRTLAPVGSTSGSKFPPRRILHFGQDTILHAVGLSPCVKHTSRT
jgi:hypothetical protein